MRRLLALVALLGAAACAPPPEVTSGSAATVTLSALPSMKRFAPSAGRRTTASNADIARDFLDLAFMLESGRPLPVLTRFEQPITLRVTGDPPPTLRIDLARLLGRLRREAGIDITRTTAPNAAITIEAVPRAAIRSVLPEAACFVVPNVRSLSDYRTTTNIARIRWSTLTRRTQLAVFLPADASPQEARDCLHEELAQAIGPLNDLYRLPDSVFNDDNFHAVLTGYDMLILRAYYDPALASGMTREQVAARLPAILARLNPAGEERPAQRLARTPEAWSLAVQTALGPDATLGQRRRAAGQAVAIATRSGWRDHRRGFAHFARGRLIQSSDPTGARADFRAAMRYFGTGPETAPHRAYAAAQLAADALARGNAAEASQLVAPHVATAARAENAALLASLLLIQAEALEAAGRPDDARRVRLDSLGWARYGFGPDWAVRAKLDEIGALQTSATGQRGGT
jgi:hypothetical protein